MIPPYICVATPTTPNWFPAKRSEATQTYGFNVAALVNPEDVLEVIEARVAPSGACELQLSNLFLEDNIIFLTTSGGVDSRIYTIKLLATTFDGQTYEWLIYQAVPMTLRGYSVPVAQCPGFGEPIEWTMPEMVGFWGFPVFGSFPISPNYTFNPAIMGGYEI